LTDEAWLAVAVELAGACVPSDAAYSVGAVVVGADSRELSRGWSRDAEPRAHAEESALARAGVRAAGATLFSSLEPCAARSAGRTPCADLIVTAGITRVVFAWREPPIFVPHPDGTAHLTAAGIEVVELPALAAAAASVNRHLAG
jgi:diaminohydroxyphosphoribosylaminopyrimidine deaminase / 5-amino-6-(5-phosphoribosylamino)uracil reductase